MLPRGVSLRTPALGAVCALQLLVFAGKVLGAEWPLWTGDEVLLRVRPVDPRSLLRGSYARLDYDISRLPWELLEGAPAEGLRRQQRVCVALRPESPASVAARATLDRPRYGPFICGRTRDATAPGSAIRLEYGIEALFATPERALAVEARARDRETPLYVRVRLSRAGRAALVGLAP